MLQQTTVATVKSYFIKFISKWPTLEKLAQADEGEVTGAWAGLGYYARARNLLKCAKIISSDYGGKFPSDYKTLLKLPGVGPIQREQLLLSPSIKRRLLSTVT